MDAFESACRAYPKATSVISALNMRRKLGESQYRVCALGYLMVLNLELTDAQRCLVDKNLGQCKEKISPEEVSELENAVDDLACARYQNLAEEAAAAVSNT